MELERIRSFLVLAERLHFGDAAALLHLSQPALSKQIKQLEAGVGAPLFDRGRHGARLTEVGRVFLEEARALVRHADATLERGRRAARGEAGRLAIGFGFSTVTLVPRLISKFRRERPEVEVELRDMSTPAQIEALRDGRVHIGFVRLPAGRELRQRPVLEDRLVIALPAHQEFVGEVKGLASLARAPFVMLPRERSVSLNDHVMALCAAYGFHPKVVQEANELPTVVALVAAGMGVALVPESQLRTRIEGVSILEVNDRSARWRVGAAWRRGAGNPALASFLAILADEMRRRDLP